MEEETVHGSPVHASVHDRREYRKKWMQEKRAAEKLKKELGKDRVGEVSLASVEKESVVQTALGGSDDETREEGVVAPNLPVTPTDMKFEEKNPGYWIYQKEEISRKCWECGKVFTTRLELNKFCGPKCKEKWLSDAFGKLRSK